MNNQLLLKEYINEILLNEESGSNVLEAVIQILPYISTATAITDFYKAYRRGDSLEMALAVLVAIDAFKISKISKITSAANKIWTIKMLYSWYKDFSKQKDLGKQITEKLEEWNFRKYGKDIKSVKNDIFNEYKHIAREISSSIKSRNPKRLNTICALGLNKDVCSSLFS